MPAPYDYFGMMGGAANIGGAQDAMRAALFNRAAQQELQQQREQYAFQQQQQREQYAFQQQQQALAQQRMAQKQQAQAALFQNPTPQAAFQYNIMFPEDTAAIKQAWGTLSEAQQQAELRTIADVNGQLQAGDADAAKATLTARKNAAAQAGEDTSEYDQLLQMIDNNPTGALGMSHLLLATVAPQSFADAYKATIPPEAKRYDIAPSHVLTDENGKPLYAAPAEPHYGVVGQNQSAYVYTPGQTPQTPDEIFGNMVTAEGGTDKNGNFLTSPKGAIGPAQLMPGTAPLAMQLAGYRPDDQSWKTDPNVNLTAGHAYYNSLVQQFGDPVLAAAAYNAGPKAVQNAVAKATKAGNPQGWLAYTPAETQNYVAKIMGGAGQATIIAQGPNANGPGGVGPPPIGDTTKTGKDYLATLPPQIQHQVQMLLDARMPLPRGFALKSPYFQQLLQAATQADPTFDATNYGSRAKARISFSVPSGNNPAAQITSLNMALGHAGQLLDLIGDTASHGGFPGVTLLNAAENAIAKSSGSSGIIKYNTVAGRLSEELTRAFRGTGGAEADIKRSLEDLSANGSYAQKVGALKAVVGLLDSRLAELRSQYQSAMGSVSTPPAGLLNPHSRQVITKILGSSEAFGTQSTQAAPRPAAPAHGWGKATVVR